MHCVEINKALHYWGILSCLAITMVAHSQTRSIDNRMYHLRTGVKAEWKNFNGRPQQNFSLHFTARYNKNEQTFSIRQVDVRQTWIVELNDIELGHLQEDESDMLSYFSIMPGTLKNGTNELRIWQRDTIPDDIQAGEFILADIPTAQFLHQASVEISVLDRDLHSLIPAHLTLVNPALSLQPLIVNAEPFVAARTGCIYTGTGKALFSIPAGNYILYAGRGFQYGVDSIKLTVKAGDTLKRTLTIEKELALVGWVAADTHIHTLSYSGHGDATMTERIITLAGEGIELPVITEHNRRIDIDSLSRTLNVRRYFTPVAGNEYTTEAGHFNIFPLETGVVADGSHVRDWNTVTQNISTTGSGRVVILNHARDIHNSFRPFDPKRHLSIAGLELDGWNFPANCMEVINSSAQQFDILQLYHDWFGMMNRGIFLTPIGSSDSHDVNRYNVGQARTYIRYEGNDPATIDTGRIIPALLSGAVMVSFGIVTAITINDQYGPGSLVPPDSRIKVNVSVMAPSWATPDSVFLFANGKKIRSEKIQREKGSKRTQWNREWAIPVSYQDQFFSAVAIGPDPAKPYWRVPKPYQPTSASWFPHIAGFSGAVWVDADGDGKKTSAHEYALRLISKHPGDLPGLIAGLKLYDEAVAIQAAAILWEQGILPASGKMDKLLSGAAPVVKHGFSLFRQALVLSR